MAKIIKVFYSQRLQLIHEKRDTPPLGRGEPSNGYESSLLRKKWVFWCSETFPCFVFIMVDVCTILAKSASSFSVFLPGFSVRLYEVHSFHGYATH